MTENVQDSSNQMYELASRRRRFFAGIADGIIFYIIMAVIISFAYYVGKHFFPSYYDLEEGLSAYVKENINLQIII
ncbi:MAG: RDD family protein, partial [Synergistaceae bacterium]|nr:RDD family protein [Synergistaceae bacterium]